ncbi:hypothetical protein Ahy_A02g007029 [Arachis hypogaea]|uniref:Uncharacterized protein n=1 Tax=Arachis hypogaea TaxID=3818 RepID=A0A445EBA2_ARAHY|nr:hypothetical protein Ahy_A02g007029 [Arachis hypogaea]
MDSYLTEEDYHHRSEENDDSIANGIPLEDFGHGHPDPNLTAVLAWLFIITHRNKDKKAGEKLISVADVVKEHWATYGRNFFSRYEYERTQTAAGGPDVQLLVSFTVLLATGRCSFSKASAQCSPSRSSSPWMLLHGFSSLVSAPSTWSPSRNPSRSFSSSPVSLPPLRNFTLSDQRFCHRSSPKAWFPWIQRQLNGKRSNFKEEKAVKQN